MNGSSTAIQGGALGAATFPNAAPPKTNIQGGHIGQSVQQTLEQAIEVAQLVDGLMQRLSPVLHPSPTPPATVSNMPPPTQPPLSPVPIANQVGKIGIALATTADKLRALHAILDL